MKKVLQIVFCLSFIGMLKSQTPSNFWTPQGATILPDNHAIIAIHIVNKDVIWAVADSATTNPFPTTHIAKVLKTTNGGTTWRLYNVLESKGRSAPDIYALDSTTAWITTNSFGNNLPNELFKTTDGGTSWTSQYNDYAASSWIRFFDAKNGIIWNRHRYALTADGGATWGATTLIGYLNTEGHGYASGSNSCAVVGDSIWAGTTQSRIVFSPDKGKTWQFQDLRPISFFGDNVYIISVSFKDARNGIALGWNSTNFTSYLARTSDGGKTWAYMTTYPFTFGSNIEYIKGTTNTYMIGDTDGLTAYSTNAGQSWVKIDSLTSNILRFANFQLGWSGKSVFKATGPAFYKWNGGNLLSSIKVLEAEDVALKISPNPTSRFLTVTYADDFQPTDLTIYAASGKTVFQKNNLMQSTQMIDLQALENGAYIVQLKTGKEVVSKKFILAK